MADEFPVCSVVESEVVDSEYCIAMQHWKSYLVGSLDLEHESWALHMRLKLFGCSGRSDKIDGTRTIFGAVDLEHVS